MPFTTRPANIPVSHTLLGLVAELDEFKGRFTLDEWNSDNQNPIAATLRKRVLESLVFALDRHNASKYSLTSLQASLDTVTEGHRDLPFDVSNIQRLHRLICFTPDMPDGDAADIQASDSKSSIRQDSRRGGVFKREDNAPEILDDTGRSMGKLYATVAAEQAEIALSDLLIWYNQQQLHPLLRAAVCIGRFIEIAPFADHNAQLVPILTEWLLLRCGYQYISFLATALPFSENQGLQDMTLTRTFRKPLEERDWSGWIVYFLTMIKAETLHMTSRQFRHNLAKNTYVGKSTGPEERKLPAKGLRTTVSHEGNNPRRLLTPLAPLTNKLLALFVQDARLTVRDIVGATGANRNTVKKHLQILVTRSLIFQHGTGKGTWYSSAQLSL